MVEHACSRGIGGRCVSAYPLFAKKAVAYRILWKIFPARVLALLRLGVERPLVGEAVALPPGIRFPGGWVIFPDVVFPSGWRIGDPLPAGVFSPPSFSPLLAENGGSESLMVGFGGGGPVHRSSPATALTYTEIFTASYWDQVVVVGYELDSIRWAVDHWKVYFGIDPECTSWGALVPKVGTTWATGYRPSKCRVTFSGGTGSVRIGLCDSGGSSLGHDLAAVSPCVISLDFSGGLDIGRFNIRDDVAGSHSALSFYITNIEFA